MTNFAVTIYRSDSREALDRALGRRSTNDEHSDFILLLMQNREGWLRYMAHIFTHPVTTDGDFQ